MIESYSFGQLIVDGRSFSSDVIIYPHRVDDGWWREEGHRLLIEDLTEVLEERPDILIVGSGCFGYMRVPEETKEYLESQGIELLVLKTEEACEAYNRLHKTKMVIAALHLSC